MKKEFVTDNSGGVINKHFERQNILRHYYLSYLLYIPPSKNNNRNAYVHIYMYMYITALTSNKLLHFVLHTSKFSALFNGAKSHFVAFGGKNVHARIC